MFLNKCFNILLINTSKWNCWALWYVFLDVNKYIRLPLAWQLSYWKVTMAFFSFPLIKPFKNVVPIHSPPLRQLSLGTHVPQGGEFSTQTKVLTCLYGS